MLQNHAELKALLRSIRPFQVNMKFVGRDDNSNNFQNFQGNFTQEHAPVAPPPETKAKAPLVNKWTLIVTLFAACIGGGATLINGYLTATKAYEPKEIPRETSTESTSSITPQIR